MDPADWEKIKDLFAETVDLSDADREEILRAVDSGVRAEVENLISGHRRKRAFIESPLLVRQGIIRDVSENPDVGDLIGSYRIVRRIGAGGMGTVYLCERDGFEQRAAVKIIKRGMDSDAIVRRFILERRILSRLNHPNITHLIDGGTTAEGLPYFVMEYVEGLPLFEYADRRGLDVQGRLALFLRICSAISFAHQNLVVHRDIKPSNVLVTEDGEPKLLDFGIAKLLDPDSEETASVSRIFTPEYASPEQISGLPVTTATDVYSLGIVLYELLCGVRPYASANRSYREISEIAGAAEPVPPSSAWRVASGRGTDNAGGVTDRILPAGLDPAQINRDLDNIMIKAIRREPERRYGTVQEFAEDIRRNLRGLPVTATADSAVYRMRKFVGRHRAATLSAALMVFLAGISVWQGVVAGRERVKAERRLAETRRIANSLMFEIHDSLATLPGATAAREILVRRALEYLDALSREPDALPELRRELAIAYRKVGDILGSYEFPSLGKGTDALANYEKAHAIQRELLQNDPDNMELLKEFAATVASIPPIYANSRNDYATALNFVREAQSAYGKLAEKEPDTVKWRSELAWTYEDAVSYAIYSNDYRRAEADSAEARRLAEEISGSAPEDPDALRNLAGIYSMTARRLGDPDYNDRGRPDEAIGFLKKALAIRDRLLSAEPDNASYLRARAIVLDDLGIIYAAKGDIEDARFHLESGLKTLRELAAKDPTDRIVRANIAYNLMKQGQLNLFEGRPRDAIRFLSESVEMHEEWHRSDPQSTGTMLLLSYSKGFLADAMLRANRSSDAERLYREALDLMAGPLERSPNYETVVPTARFQLQIGKLRRLADCKEAAESYRRSFSMLDDLRQKIPLSPSNAALYENARHHVETTVCD